MGPPRQHGPGGHGPPTTEGKGPMGHPPPFHPPGQMGPPRLPGQSGLWAARGPRPWGQLQQGPRGQTPPGLLGHGPWEHGPRGLGPQPRGPGGPNIRGQQEGSFRHQGMHKCMGVHTVFIHMRARTHAHTHAHNRVPLLTGQSNSPSD